MTLNTYGHGITSHHVFLNPETGLKLYQDVCPGRTLRLYLVLTYNSCSHVALKYFLYISLRVLGSFNLCLRTFLLLLCLSANHSEPHLSSSKQQWLGSLGSNPTEATQWGLTCFFFLLSWFFLSERHERCFSHLYLYVFLWTSLNFLLCHNPCRPGEVCVELKPMVPSYKQT